MSDKIKDVKERISAIKSMIAEGIGETNYMTAMLEVNEDILMLLEGGMEIHFSKAAPKEEPGFFLPLRSEVINSFIGVLN